jgi:hypothetical protein
MKQFIVEQNKHMDGVQKVYQFPNGYGASVIKHKGSYGYSEGLWELAVLHEGELCYNTEITNDVIGYLTDEDLDVILVSIKELN